jgi:predicted nucleic acid-binding protein
VTRYLLDTDALIDFSKRRDPAYSQILAWIDAGDLLGASAITIAEFYSGLTQNEAAAWEEFVSSLAYWDIGVWAAMQAGQDRYRFARQGRIITTTDALVAAAARQYGAVLVTGNTKDYPMEDISVFPLA